MGTEITVIILLLFVLVILIFLMSGKKKSPKRDEWIIREEESPIKNAFGSKCPLCGQWLEKGEKVHSHLYPGKPDGMMHIFGCPHCYQGHPDEGGRGGSGRICPFCHETLGPKDYVIARVFEKPGKTQVHVLGCTICRDRR
ncbi:MAG: hypothetical protein PQJ59_05130 [Spirochaetales bacterium]|nr:hypothetical protein [Spirochaetales bacterium]